MIKDEWRKKIIEIQRRHVNANIWAEENADEILNYIAPLIAQAERKRIRIALNKHNAPDTKDWETGTGGKLAKVLLFTKDEWSKFWQSLGEKGE